jgi:hypothetical protein
MANQARYSRFVGVMLFSLLTLFATYAPAAPPSYAAQVLADGPIGYWRLGEAPGATTAADSSGRMPPRTGTYSAADISLGQPGFHGGDTAVRFDGSGGIHTTGRVVVLNPVIQPGNPDPDLNPPMITMEAKVSWSGPNRFQQRILEKSSFAEIAQYGLSILDDGHVRVEVRIIRANGVGDSVCQPLPPPPQPSSTMICAVNSQNTVGQNVETHVVATYDEHSIKIYLNGSLDIEANLGANSGFPLDKKPQSDLETALGIGNQSQRDRPFNGVIDEVALFDKALSQDQVRAHYQAQLEQAKIFQYAVKFVCGKSPGRVVAPGEYFTAINVHNPNERAIGFKKKFAIALPGERPGRVSKFFEAKLGPDEAFEIDCPDIFRRTESTEGFVKGFAVLETARELDVVAVYTAAGATGRVETMELERVSPRIERAPQGKPDLIPVPDRKLGFCKRKDLKLTVTVKNQGSADAGPSVTTVDFGAAGTASQPTPALAAGASIDLVFDIPPSCFHGDCHFKITVDSNSQVDESDETNNTASGVCVG